MDKKILIIGIGNDGRQDDGLGWRFLDLLEDAAYPFDLEYRYQLQIEDAELVSRYRQVIFVDATKDRTDKGFAYRPCVPKEDFQFTTHALLPESVLYLSEKLYGVSPEAYLLAISGCEWNLKTGLSRQAKINLQHAFGFFKNNVHLPFLKRFSMMN